MKTSFLLIFINMHPEFQQNSSRIGNLLFHVVDLAISPFPLTFCRKTFDTFDQHSSIPGTVKNRHMSCFWKFFPESPQIMMGFFNIIWRRCRNHFITTRIHGLRKTFDRASFSSGIPAFECKNHRQTFQIHLIVKGAQFFLQFFLFYLILFFCH